MWNKKIIKYNNIENSILIFNMDFFWLIEIIFVGILKKKLDGKWLILLRLKIYVGNKGIVIKCYYLRW